jgi:hypothetical protein
MQLLLTRFFAVRDFEAAARVFLTNRPSQKFALRQSMYDQLDSERVAGAELAADQSMHVSQRTEHFHQQKQEDGGSLTSTVSDDKDSDLDFLMDHLKAIDERLKSAKTGQHEASLRAERDRTTTMIQTIAGLKRLNDAIAAKKKLEEEKRRLALMAKIREKMCTIGRCPMDFAWRWEGKQFRCEGGSHFATAQQLGVSVEDCVNFFSKTGVVDV